MGQKSGFTLKKQLIAQFYADNFKVLSKQTNNLVFLINKLC